MSGEVGWKKSKEFGIRSIRTRGMIMISGVTYIDQRYIDWRLGWHT
jgi:hypothetical protein